MKKIKKLERTIQDLRNDIVLKEAESLYFQHHFEQAREEMEWYRGRILAYEANARERDKGTKLKVQQHHSAPQEQEQQDATTDEEEISEEKDESQASLEEESEQEIVELAWKEAGDREVERCEQRDEDQGWAGKYASPWTTKSAFERFEFILTEFEGIEFSPEQPLCIDNIPWPLFDYPQDLNIQNVTVENVGIFLDYLKYSLQPGVFAALLERLEQAFHPRAWQLVLNSVYDDEERNQLRGAGNRVARGVTQWRRTQV
jgi:hypothetical protein